MNVKKMNRATALTLNKRKNTQRFILLSSLLFAGLFFAAYVSAETNAEGVEIEIIANDSSEITGDPVQTFLSDIDTSADVESNQNDLWARIKDGYAMPEVESSYTANHEAWYAARPDYVKRMVERSQKYLFHIVEEVQKRGMPTEIALLPMVESAFNPQAFSRSSASGIWQFVPATGKDFGLKQNWWVDNRRDVTAATTAALNYLQKLHGMFGAWDLALAAYNAGEGTVQRAINRNKSLGLATDYQSLDLPIETKNYVPKLQAIKNIMTEPERFGLTIHSVPNQAYFSRVNAPKQIDTKLAAQLAEISFEEFTSLNPSYNRPVISSNGEAQQFLLPTWAAKRFTNNLENYNKPLTSWQTYQAKRGERMDNIAKKFGINVNQLRSVNSLSGANKMYSAQAMLVPASYGQGKVEFINMSDNNQLSSAERDATNNKDENTLKNEPSVYKSVLYKVKRGETLSAVADKYNVDEKTLKKINHLKNDKLFAGQVLRVNTGSISTKNNKIIGVNTVKDKATNHASNKTSLNVSANKHSKITTRNHKAHRVEARSHFKLR